MEYLSYFLEIIKNRDINFAKDKKKIVILGTAFPEELLYAFGVTPYWILGGDMEMARYADFVPRDADPISRSILGYLWKNLEYGKKNTFIIVPLINDNSKKMLYLLQQQGFHVYPFFLPSDHNTEEAFSFSIDTCVEMLEHYFHKILTKKRIEKGQLLLQNAAREAKNFYRMAGKNRKIIDDITRMMVLNSYYYTRDVEEWTKQLSLFNHKLNKLYINKENLKANALLKESKVLKEYQEKGRILILGSPVYPPNNKIPELLLEAGLRILMNVDYTSMHLLTLEEKTGKEQGSFVRFYRQDCSPAYVENDTLYEIIKSLLTSSLVDGVVIHILKGQMEYDFELLKWEELLTEKGIPMIRLETDYNKQDIEQLRIRIEAFAEMLFQKQRKKGA